MTLFEPQDYVYCYEILALKKLDVFDGKNCTDDVGSWQKRNLSHLVKILATKSKKKKLPNALRIR